MKVSVSVSGKYFLGSFNVSLACLILFMMLPFMGREAYAESDNVTDQLEIISENVTTDIPDDTINMTSGNITIETDNLTGNMTIEVPALVKGKIIRNEFSLSTNLSERNITLVNSENETRLRSEDGKLSLQIPKGAVDKSIAVEITPIPFTGSTSMKIINIFELNAWEVDRSKLPGISSNNSVISGENTPNTNTQQTSDTSCPP